MPQYPYGNLLSHGLVLSTYVGVIVSIVACYMTRMFFLRASLLLVTLIFALYANRIDWTGLAFILALGGLFYSAFEPSHKGWRRLFYFLTVIACFAIIMHLVPGIYNWKVLSSPFSLSYNLDKSVIGLFFLWFGTYTLAKEGKWGPSIKTGLLCGFAAVMVLFPIALALHYVRVDIKTTNLFFIWAVHNLFFTCLAEEVLFRGMILKTLLLYMQHYAGGKWIALVLSSIIFGAVHFQGGLYYVLFAGLAGLFYGYAFMRTDKIEASVVAHFTLNAIHFVGFSYPALL